MKSRVGKTITRRIYTRSELFLLKNKWVERSKIQSVATGLNSNRWNCMIRSRIVPHLVFIFEFQTQFPKQISNGLFSHPDTSSGLNYWNSLYLQSSLDMLKSLSWSTVNVLTGLPLAVVSIY